MIKASLVILMVGALTRGEPLEGDIAAPINHA